MKKRILTIIITLAMAMGMISATTTTVFADNKAKPGTWGEYEEIGGEYKYTYADFSPFVESDQGTMDNPYVIYSPYQLAALAALVNAYNEGSDVKLTDLDGNTVTATNFFVNSESQHIKLMENLDLIGLEWVPIGADSSNAFKGNFDGNGYTISGMAIGTADAANQECQYAGLFGYMTAGSIKNLSVSGLVNVSYSASYAGGIVGYAQGDNSVNVISIENCSSNVSVISNGDAGGIAAYTRNVTITNCYNAGSVSGSGDYVGGVVGRNYSGVSNCYNTGSVTCSSSMGYVGGVAGRNYSGTVTNCYNTGSVSGSGDYVGGVVGRNESSGKISNCYNIGSVSGSSDYVGGVVGRNISGTVSDCYNTGSVSGNNNVGGVVGYNSDTIGGGTGGNSSTVTNCYNTGSVSGSGSYVGGVVGDNYSTVTNCYYLTGKASGGIAGADAQGQAEAKTSAQFASGEVAYLLNGDQNAIVWYQTCGEGLPAFSGNTVYKATKGCTGAYVNDQNAEPEHAFTADSNGFCTKCDGYQPAELNGGVYEISNAGQLYWFAAEVNSGQTTINGKLTKNIEVNPGTFDTNGNYTPKNDESARVWTPIGNSTNKYNGTFDGAGYTVSGLYFNSETTNIGLFGWVDKGGIIQDVGVINSYFSGWNSVGGIVANNCGTVQNCFNSGTVSGSNSVGGIVGYSNNANVENCYNTGAVSGTTNAGGVVGSINLGKAQNCYNIGTVSGTDNIGGVVGNSSAGNVQNCYNTGAVSGTTNVGGVVGKMQASATMQNCFNFSAGGVVGYIDSSTSLSTVQNCYYLAESETDSIDGTIFKTSEQFASGEVAFLLGDAFGQTIGTDATPVFKTDKNTVYKNQISGCSAATFKYEYSNEQKAAVTTHDVTKYTYANGSIANSITATCGDCQTAAWTVTLAAPENAVYNGQRHNATLVGEIPGVEVSINYNTISYPIKAGTYTASVTLDNVYVRVEYKIAQKALTPYIAGRVTKVYDGTNSVPAGLSIALDGIVGADNVTASAIIYTFDSPDAGTKKVNAASILLGGADAGNYTLSSSTASADVGEITKAPSRLLTAPAAIGGLVYDKQVHPLVTPGTAEFGTLVYSLDGVNWSANIPTAVNAGSYTVFYKIVGDKNHLDSAPAVIPVVIARREIGIIWGQTAFEYNGERQAPTATVTGVLPGDVCDVTVSGWGKFGGTYTAKVESIRNENYILSGDTTCQFTIIANPIEVAIDVACDIYDIIPDSAKQAVGDAASDAANEVYEDCIAPAITNAFNEMLENLCKTFQNLFK